MRSEFSANKALFETAFSNTFNTVKKVAEVFSKKGKLADYSSLNDMSSMKEWQAKNNAFGKVMFVID